MRTGKIQNFNLISSECWQFKRSSNYQSNPPKNPIARKVIAQCGPDPVENQARLMYSLALLYPKLTLLSRRKLANNFIFSCIFGIKIVQFNKKVPIRSIYLKNRHLVRFNNLIIPKFQIQDLVSARFQTKCSPQPTYNPHFKIRQPIVITLENTYYNLIKDLNDAKRRFEKLKFDVSVFQKNAAIQKKTLNTEMQKQFVQKFVLHL